MITPLIISTALDVHADENSRYMKSEALCHKITITAHINLRHKCHVSGYPSDANVARYRCNNDTGIVLRNKCVLGKQGDRGMCLKRHLTHLPLDKMAAISQTIFSDEFS